MALKDWKEIPAEENAIINWMHLKKEELYTGIDKDNIFYIESAHGGRLKHYNFKSKSQALKFAKQYMRTH